MKTTPRFKFWRVFWVTLAITIFFCVIGLIAFFVFPNMNNSMNWRTILSWQNVLDQAFGVVFFTFYYYLTLNLFYKIIVEHKSTYHFVRPVVISFIILGVYHILNFLVMDKMKVQIELNNRHITNEFTIAAKIFSYVMMAFFVTGFSLTLAYLTSLRDDRKQRKILEAQKMQLEIEKSQANFNFLKAQINPHFLHNTLNFLYAKSLPYSHELSEGILTLSEIMRYALSEGNAKDGRAPLKDEIEHVRNVIKINQLRFSNNLKVQFEVEGVVNGATIIPFVLITLVENAFKHGDLKSMEHPIVIRLRVDKNLIYFYCRNKKKTGSKELSTGIGLDNIRKRLDLAYGSNYVFQVKDEAEFYTTELTITSI